MSQQTQLARFRPAVLAITGLAAVCGAYVLYTTYAEVQAPSKNPPQNGPLRRRGAVRRERASRPTMKVIIDPTDRRGELGAFTCIVGEQQETFLIMLDANPTPDMIRRSFGQIPDNTDLQRIINIAKAECILTACFVAEDEHARSSFSDENVCILAEQMVSRDIVLITTAAVELLPLIMSEPIERSHIDEALAAFLRSDIFTSAPRTAGRTVDAERDTTITETDDLDGGYPAPTEPTQGLKGLLYHIARADANRKAYEHRGIHCDECGESPLRGIRWHCMNCPDWDLCSTCEANTRHPQTHIFAKIRVPFPILSRLPRSQPSWYPGDPRELHDPLSPEYRKEAQESSGFEAAQIDALYDQFCCFANVKYTVNGTDIGFGIDREAFLKATYPRITKDQSFMKPNVVYDRMFDFYDTDKNGMISFDEFISGMAYLRGPKRFASLTRTLQGYDIDGDGYVDRRDFIRLFRAKHEIQNLLVHKMVEAQEAQYTQEGMDRLRSSQPISSIFADEEIPSGERRARTGKRVDQNGDLQPLPGVKTILEDDQGWPTAEERRLARKERQRPPHERLRGRLSAFGEVLSEESEPFGGGVQITNAELDAVVFDGTTDHDQKSKGHVDNEGGPELDQDVLWEILEEAFHEMLDPLFAAREREEEAAIKTREYRSKWSWEIQNYIAGTERKVATKKEFESGAETDPLMATAMSAYNSPYPNHQERQENSRTADLPPGTMVLVPTDTESLSRREREISQQPLDELLTASGYQVIDDYSDTSAMNGHPRIPETLLVDVDVHTNRDIPKDPTMPQHRPNSSAPTEVTDDTTARLPSTKSSSREREATVKLPPSGEHLATLAHHHHIEQQIEIRGGRGKLDFNEVANLVKIENQHDLKGLVTSWLDWASF